MARIKLGAMVSSVQGSIGGIAFSDLGNARVVRAAPRPTLNQTPRALQQRSWTANLSTRWSHTLSEVQRQAWRDRARDRGAAQQLYIGGNIARLNAGLIVQDAAPADVSPSALRSLLLGPTAPAQVNIFFTPSPLAAGDRLYVYAVEPSLLGKPRAVREFSFLGVSPSGQVSPYDIGSPLTSRYGTYRRETGSRSSSRCYGMTEGFWGLASWPHSHRERCK